MHACKYGRKYVCMNACTVYLNSMSVQYVCIHVCFMYVSCTYIRTHTHAYHAMLRGSGDCQSDKLANWQVTGKTWGFTMKNVGFMGFKQENEKLHDEHLGIVVI